MEGRRVRQSFLHHRPSTTPSAAQIRAARLCAHLALKGGDPHTMERPHKLMATAMSQGLKICTVRLDRYSSLPDHIAHHILSFLTMEDVARFMVTCKRCRELCITSPFLTFNGLSDLCYRPWLHNFQKHNMCMSALDRFFVQRGRRKICNLSIHCCLRFSRNELSRAITWLRIAAQCYVEVLDLECVLRLAAKFAFPLCLFTCGSLRSVTVKLNGGVLELPSSLGFTNLQSLSISSVKVFNKCFGEWISSFCKSLKELRLESIEEINSINISSSSLVHFSLENSSPSELCHLSVGGEKLEVMNVEWRFNSSSGKSLKIFAPNLKYFSWKGYPTNDNHLGSLMHLKGAQLLLEPKEDTYENLHHVIHGVSRIEDLTLDDLMTKVLFEQGCLPTCFGNMGRLYMYVSCLNDDLVPAMVSLIRGMPNLKSISMKSSPPPANTNLQASGFDAGYWESQNLTFIHHLQLAEIELFGGKNELGLASFLLKHAKELKKMTIFYSSCLPQNVRLRLRNCAMASAATVVFQRKM
ncbi:hypothetical protein Vadar_019690 [Vaccinium darrowii]|uniref:Uncharacterized protein n=1 Tax=Vaccinium darrowii TaxID=229202 RepID=A0ACB7Y951_9ERIC|nr:hypothetical protein Vadar_019690 [Vaccinium darrowii]